MKFGERLKNFREQKNLTQEELASLSGISARSIQRYENGTNRPRVEAAEKMAKALDIQVDVLLGTNDMLVAEAKSKYGYRGAKQAQELVEEVSGLFSGGEIADEDLDAMMKAIQDAYWIAKEKNKKFSPKNKARK